MSCRNGYDRVSAAFCDAGCPPGGTAMAAVSLPIPDTSRTRRERLFRSGRVCPKCGAWHQGDICPRCGGNGSLQRTVRDALGDPGRLSVSVVYSPGILSDPSVRAAVREHPSPVLLLGAAPDALVRHGLGDVLQDLIERYPDLASASARARQALQEWEKHGKKGGNTR